MGQPSGNVVGHTQVIRACGCKQEFQQFTKDRFADQRVAKLRKTRCPACAAAFNAEQQRLAAAVPRKGEALKQLPAGSRIALTRKPDGTWVGTLSAEGTETTAEGEGINGVTVTLARRWIAARTPDAAAKQA